MPNFQQAWIGYDLPFDEIEQQPSVKTLRGQGVIKRVKLPEHHVTVRFFASIDLEALTQLVAQAETNLGAPLTNTTFTFDGYGSLKQDAGTYVYFSPQATSAKEATFLRTFLSEHLETPEPPSDLHLSIGGPDPFKGPKPRQMDLKEPFAASGRLVFVGKSNGEFLRFVWNSQTKQFTSEQAATSTPSATPSAPLKPFAIHTIALFPKIQADTASAVYLIQQFGENLFPGAAKANLVFWSGLPEGKTPAMLKDEGFLLLDLGGELDHHLVNARNGKRADCLTTLVAKHLGLENHPALQKLLAWTKRDDLDGKGTISADPIDRAFGLSGIIMNLNREYKDSPEYVLQIVTHLIDAHFREEHRRHVELPREWEQLQEEGKAQSIILQQGSAQLSGVALVSDNTALAGYLKAAQKLDVIIQRSSKGHTNILTQQLRSLDLRPVIAEIRLAEAEKKGIRLPSSVDPGAGGRVDAIPEWYYDEAANTLQNGGVNPTGVNPTQLSLEEITAIVIDAMPRGVIGSLKRKKIQQAG